MTKSGEVYVISATFDPLSDENGVEVLVDNNFFIRVAAGNPEFANLLREMHEKGYRINPIAAALEQVASNREEYSRLYLAFRKNCVFGASYEELPLGGKESVWIRLSWNGYFLRNLVLRCYVLFFATLLRKKLPLVETQEMIRTFLTQQPVRQPIIGFLFLLCSHLLGNYNYFRLTDELRLIEKFFQLPATLDDQSLKHWARNRAADMDVLFAAHNALRLGTHLADLPPSGVMIATSDRFVANVLLRYCCASRRAEAPFSIDEQELVLLHPAIFDLLPKPDEPWARASNGLESPTVAAEFYFPLWEKLSTEARTKKTRNKQQVGCASKCAPLRSRAT